MGNEQSGGSERNEDDAFGIFLKEAMLKEQKKREQAMGAALIGVLAGLETIAKAVAEESDDEEVVAGKLPEDFAKESNYRWDSESCSPNIKLSKDGVTAVKKKTNMKSTDLVMGSEGYKSGIHAFKIFSPRSKRGNLPFVVGLASKSTPLKENGFKALVGGQDKSVGWDIVSKRGLYNGNIISSYPENRGSDFQVPELFIMIADLNRGVLLFKTDDDDYGVCLSGLDQVFSDQGILLYPAISMTTDDCEISIAKYPLVINPQRERIGHEKLVPAWVITNILMKNEKLEECPDVVKLVLQFHALFQKTKETEVKEVLLKIVVGLNKCKTLVEYLDFCWRNVEKKEAEGCFLVLTLAILSFSNDNSLFPIAWNESGGFKVIEKILNEVNGCEQFDKKVNI